MHLESLKLSSVINFQFNQKYGKHNSTSSRSLNSKISGCILSILYEISYETEACVTQLIHKPTKQFSKHKK